MKNVVQVDPLHLLHKRPQAILSCGQHYSTLPTWIVPRRLVWWRLARLQIHVGWTVMHLWFAHFRASVLDEHKASGRVSEQCRVRDHLA